MFEAEKEKKSEERKENMKRKDYIDFKGRLYRNYKESQFKEFT